MSHFDLIASQMRPISFAATLAAGICTVQSRAAEPFNLCDREWKHVTASAAVSEPAGAWNPDTGRFMVYGGYMNGWSPETWEFDGQKWIRLDVDTPRQLVNIATSETIARASMAYDQNRQKMCLALQYTRASDRAAAAELFEWEGGTWKLKATLPPDFQSTFFFPRIHLVFDYAANRLLVLNSLGSGDLYTARPLTGWYFNGDSFTPVAFTPDAYWTLFHQVSSDPIRKRVLFTSAFPESVDANFESSGQAISPALPFPMDPAVSFAGGPVYGMSSYYSPPHAGFVQYGGFAGQWLSGRPQVEIQNAVANKTTALWDGSLWLTLSGGSPQVSGGVACFDPINSRGLHFGGRSRFYEVGTISQPTNLRTGEVWQLVGDMWSNLATPPLGSLWSKFAAQLDPRSGRLVVAGSVSENGIGRLSHSEWDGARWLPGPTQSGTIPLDLKELSRMAWDPEGQRMIAIVPTKPSPSDNILYRTLAYDGASWSQIGADRTGMMNWRLVTNSVEGKVWLTDRGQNSGVFELGGPDGNTWVQRSAGADGIIQTQDFEAYFDDARNRVVVVGSSSNGLLTQEFDGTSWGAPQFTSPFSTSSQRGAGRNWNPLLRAVVAINYQPIRSGIAGDSTPLGFPRNSDHRLAIWNGTSWQIINDGGAHPADAGYIWQDQQSGRWFSYGGTPRSDIWELVPLTGDRFIRQPADAIGYAGRTVSASFEFRGGVGPVSYSWRVNGTPITASPTINGNTVSGWSKPVISITGLKAGTDATLDCVITTGCDTYTTQPIRLFATCLGDLNADSMVDDADFVIFASCYDNYYTPEDKPLCRLDNSSQVTDDKDFLVFVAAYDAGVCP